ncbi:hypothetical protein DY000_02046381 [Brassica cretica]|uniref:Uncharacterized protein n=1 Tax=Brassica cretica TaxID=69181 RepID=A0ABQ7EQ06_BRACR|nr:hypothetical protein DY000_02046381 [Brassica cretica]
MGQLSCLRVRRQAEVNCPFCHQMRYWVLGLCPQTRFIPLSISPRHSLALQVYTTPAQHLDSTWSSPLNPTSASATTSATTSGQTSYIFIGFKLGAANVWEQ